MKRAAAFAASMGAVVMLAAGCSAPGGVSRDPGSSSTPEAKVDDAPDMGNLEAARVEAGIADCPDTTDQAGPANGLPEVTLPCLGEARTVTLSGLRGPMVLNVWAQWCGPCRAEAPILAEVSAEAGEKLPFIGVIYNDPRPDYALEFAKLAGWRYPHVLDPDKSLQGPLKIPGPPMTLFIDAEGGIAYRHVGPFSSAKQLRQLAAEHLGVSL